MRWLLVALMLLASNTASAQTLPDVITKINSTLPTARSINAANLRTVLNYMAGANTLTSGLTSTINSSLTSGSALSASTVVTVLEDFTSNLGISNQLNTYIAGTISSGGRISAAGLRKVLTTLATAMFNSVTIYSLPNSDVIHYMASNGNDACNGTSTTIGSSGNCAWLTPNHALNCGDVIIAATGSYTTQFNNTITNDPSNCPSTTGGIDGKGGVYFVTILCAGTDLESCTVAGSAQFGFCNGCSTGTHGYWSMQGFKLTVGGGGNHAYEALGCGPSKNIIVHHFAFINDIAYNSGDAYNTGDCGSATNVPGNGVDYFAVVGSIAQNSVQDTVCLGAIDTAGPANSDTTQQTHTIFYGNFSYDNTTSCTLADSEDYLLDTLDAHGYTGTVVVSNNVGIQSCHANLGVFYQNYNNSSPEPIVNIYNNTFYAGEFCVTNIFAGAELLLNTSNAGGLGTGIPWTVSVYNNIARAIYAHPGGGSSSNGNIYAFQNGGNASTHITVGGTGKQNIFWGVAGGCNATACDSTDSAAQFNGNVLGTNTYVDPAFQNGSDVLSSRIGTPSCTNMASVTQCMGYNVLSGILTANSVLFGLVPTASGMAGKGYQYPSGSCITNTSPFYADYPNWLKGIVRLAWISGSSTIIQVRDLVSVPCGM